MPATLSTVTLASGTIAVVDENGRVTGFLDRDATTVRPPSFTEQTRRGRLGRSKAENEYARKVWVDLGCRAKQYGYRTNKLSGYARKRAYRRILNARGIPTLVNNRAHG